VRKRGGRKRALGMRAPMPVPSVQAAININTGAVFVRFANSSPTFVAFMLIAACNAVPPSGMPHRMGK
jgi:hypothetical protein